MGKYIRIIVPIAVIIISFYIHPLLGTAVILVSIGLLFYFNRYQVYALKGRQYYANNDMEKAIIYFRKAMSAKKPSPDIVISYGYLLLKNGDPDNAEKVIDNLINRKDTPDDKKEIARALKALIIWKKGDIDKAIETLEDVLKKVETTNIYGSLGYLYILKGDLDKALEFNLKAYEYNNSNAVIVDNLGQTYYLRKEYDKAAELYEKLMNKEPKPNFPEAYYNYGLVLLETKGRDEAVKYIEKALTYKFTYLSTVSREQMEKTLEEIKKGDDSSNA
mgnify:FL=1